MRGMFRRLLYDYQVLLFNVLKIFEIKDLIPFIFATRPCVQNVVRVRPIFLVKGSGVRLHYRLT
jgi:hypothetical protein